MRWTVRSAAGAEAAAVAALAIAAFANALQNGFVYDDGYAIVGNWWLRDLGSLPAIFGSHAWGFSPSSTVQNYYRPGMYVALLATYQVFGLAPWAFHLLNLALHAATSVMVFVVVRRLLVLSPEQASTRTRDLAAFAGAALFAVHPIHTEAITWASALPEPAFTLLGLLAFDLHVRASRPAQRWAAAAALFGAALFKETALALPIVLVAYDLATGAAGRGLAALARRHLPYALAVGVYLAIRISVLGALAPLRQHAELGAYELVLNAFPLLAQYLGKLVFPTGLTPYHVLDPVHSMLESRALVAVGVVASAAAAAAWSFRRSPLVFVALAMIVAPLLPVLLVASVGENTFAERYLYFPSIGAALLVALGVHALSRTGWRSRLLLGATVAAIALVAIGFVAATFARNAVWRNEETLWADTVQKSPRAGPPHDALGCVRLEQGRLDEAVALFRRAIELKPELASAHSNLAIALGRKGEFAAALRHAARALELRPRMVEAHNNLGILYGMMGRPSDAAAQFTIAIGIDPRFADGYRNLGLARGAEGRPDESLAALRRAVELDPSSAAARNDLGVAYAERRDYARAAEEFTAAAGLRPDDADIRANLARIRSVLDR